MIFDPKKGGHFLTPPHLPENLKQMGFKGGGSRGIRTKNSLGDAFIGQNNDFTRGVMCLGVWGYGGMYAVIALSHHCREESLKVAVLRLPPSPLPSPLLFPRAPRLVCEKNS